MGIGKDKEFAAGSTLLEAVEIHFETSVFDNEWTFDQPTARRGGYGKKWWIDRRGYEYPVARLGEGLYHKRDASYDAGDEMQLLSSGADGVSTTEPAYDGVKIGL